MNIQKLIDYLQQKQKEGYTEVNVCIDGLKEYYICNLVDSMAEDADGKPVYYISLMVDSEDEF